MVRIIQNLKKKKPSSFDRIYVKGISEYQQIIAKTAKILVDEHLLKPPSSTTTKISVSDMQQLLIDKSILANFDQLDQSINRNSTILILVYKLFLLQKKIANFKILATMLQN